MQENRSFDSYFGTFPGADGIPMKNGAPTVCVPDPATGTCVAPYVDHADVNGGGPALGASTPTADINGGKMDGFIGQAESGRKGCLDPDRPGLHQLGHARRDGLPHRERHPELLDLRQGLRAPGPHVRAERVVEPARPPLPGLRVVGVLHPGRQPVELRERPADQARRATREHPAVYGGEAGPKTAAIRSSNRGRRPAHLRLDRPDLPALQVARQLGLLRRQRRPSPTARTTPPRPAPRSSRTPTPPGSGTRCPGSTR